MIASFGTFGTGMSDHFYEVTSDYYDMYDYYWELRRHWGDGMYLPQVKAHVNPHIPPPKKIYLNPTYQKPIHINKTPDSRSGIKGVKRLQREGRHCK